LVLSERAAFTTCKSRPRSSKLLDEKQKGVAVGVADPEILEGYRQQAIADTSIRKLMRGAASTGFALAPRVGITLMPRPDRQDRFLSKLCHDGHEARSDPQRASAASADHAFKINSQCKQANRRRRSDRIF
jgi:hypothetical protein